MPPKPKKSTGAKKKVSKLNKRPSKISVVSVNERSKNERSVMQSIEQEEATNNEIVPTPKKTTAQIAQQPTPTLPQIIAKQEPEVAMKTMMLPPPSDPPPPPPPVAPHQPPPQLATSAQPPQPPVINSQLPRMSPAPAIPPSMAQPLLQSPSPGADIAIRRPSKEKTDEKSVDETGGSDKKKRTEVICSWIRLVLQNGVAGLKKEYRDSPNEAPEDIATSFLGNPTRNRYRNIPCCDITRVKLTDDPHFYIHANLVSSGPNPRRFICTQAPLNGTIEEFWKMIIVTGIEYIVMLCELVEKGKPKSAEYFPSQIGQTTKIGRLCTVTKESRVDIDKTLVMSTMRISKPGDNAVVKIVKHIHWRNWPDHGVPDNFLSPFRLLTVVKNCTKPIVVHCSAGVGRTGTLALILIILESICLPDFIGVPRLLAKLREERFRAVQTEMQYLYAHRCVLEYLALKKYVQSREDFAKFAKDYEQALAMCPKEA
ncbi:Protein-tyrosine phosphatase [Caenorhabditis elegans]|uniref:Protein-tyrosine phosphatase n=1 Tax=Caenorhabditis elegans TaxID=6239 RepID=P91568_CAEEL|nr:Protein-tyrosine phosphatase [Caenorhabditis elegans]CCD70685.1 Protein-tyrosine phosphatase [Caenorhabditis elegans]|eukprot:NP_500775.1 Tyrosine-protein phosphatase [Caenorhabditis elegans]